MNSRGNVYWCLRNEITLPYGSDILPGHINSRGNVIFHSDVLISISSKEEAGYPCYYSIQKRLSSLLLRI